MRKFGNKVYYGDASRLELLESARARDAKLFVLAIDDVEASMKTAAIVRQHFPDLPILARARNRVHYYRLRDLDILGGERETFRSSLETARQALEKLGFESARAARAVDLFRKHDLAQLDVQYAVRQDEAAAHPDGCAGGGATAGAVRIRRQGKRGARRGAGRPALTRDRTSHARECGARASC